MLQLLKHNLTFYIGYLMLLMFAVIFILNTDQLELHSIINQHVGISFWDQFFKYITHLGDGLFLMTLAVGLFLVDSKKALTLLIAYGISGGLTQFLKVNFFNDVMRPFFYHYGFLFIHHFCLVLNK